MIQGELNMAFLAPGCIFLALSIGYDMAVLQRRLRGSSGSGDVRARIVAHIAKIKYHQQRREKNLSSEKGMEKAPW